MKFLKIFSRKMSRIGKNPVHIPSGVEVSVEKNIISIKGKKGNLVYSFDPRITVSVEGSEVVVARPDDEKESKSLHGTTRSLIANMIQGVSEGFQKRLEINGVGYRAAATGKKITMNLGFSHPVEMDAPEGLSVEWDQETKNIVITGADKQKVGQFAAEVREWRKPEPYKGKGIKYTDEHVTRKAGKTAGKK